MFGNWSPQECVCVWDCCRVWFYNREYSCRGFASRGVTIGWEAGRGDHSSRFLSLKLGDQCRVIKKYSCDPKSLLLELLLLLFPLPAVLSPPCSVIHCCDQCSHVKFVLLLSALLMFGALFTRHALFRSDEKARYKTRSAEGSHALGQSAGDPSQADGVAGQ